jgi:hypothetical protein
MRFDVALDGLCTFVHRCGNQLICDGSLISANEILERQSHGI